MVIWVFFLRWGDTDVHSSPTVLRAYGPHQRGSTHQGPATRLWKLDPKNKIKEHTHVDRADKADRHDIVQCMVGKEGI